MAALPVTEYLTYFLRQRYDRLFDETCLDRLAHVRSCFGQLQTEETILEVCLSAPEKYCDYSIRVDVDHPLVKEYWYELDSDACQSADIIPCCFVDASAMAPGADHQAFYQEVLTALAGTKRTEMLMPGLERCVEELTGKCPSLFQIGVMTGRKQSDSVRLFTEDMSRTHAVEYLKAIGWRGDTAALDDCLKHWEKYSDRGQFILDFDLYAERISDKIGINFGICSKAPQMTDECLQAMEEQALCLPGKRKDVLRFLQAFPSHTPFIQNDLSHLKIPFLNGRALMAKAYLRQGSKCFWSDYRAYETPVLMNLELTTRCPLRCPQCYCDLERGKELDLERALYWIEQARICGVRTVNLSGGETMCYPELNRLIAACRDAGMEANIAVSGWKITEETLDALIDSGVSEICVSLNGSTKAVNEKTRDGYELAVHALTLLDACHYPRTSINWVMHRVNAADFGQMIGLAERFHVRSLVVMMLKPDVSGVIPDGPDGAQIRQVAQQIKAYRGPVQIEVEECFSQMRAILGKRYFTNLNRGISRGCGAGRDGISVSVDGKLTPCRHLELEESFETIRDYWEQSVLLKRLRSVEDSPQAPCGGCEYRRYCLPCMAVNWKLKQELVMGDAACPLRPEA